MPYCPKCAGKLTKRKNPKAYYCRRHGFVRKVMSPKSFSEEINKETKNDS